MKTDISAVNHALHSGVVDGTEGLLKPHFQMTTGAEECVRSLLQVLGPEAVLLIADSSKGGDTAPRLSLRFRSKDLLGSVPPEFMRKIGEFIVLFNKPRMWETTLEGMTLHWDSVRKFTFAPVYDASAPVVNADNAKEREVCQLTTKDFMVTARATRLIRQISQSSNVKHLVAPVSWRTDGTWSPGTWMAPIRQRQAAESAPPESVRMVGDLAIVAESPSVWTDKLQGMVLDWDGQWLKFVMAGDLDFLQGLAEEDESTIPWEKSVSNSPANEN